MDEAGPQQELLLIMIAMKRQAIETAKMIALCKSAICGAEINEASMTLIEDAGKAVRVYQRLAENITIAEDKTDDEMRKVLEKETKQILHVRPA